MNGDRCISCDEPIQWAQTLRAGKRIPLDPGPVADGNLEVVYSPGETLVVRLVPLAERDGRDDLRRTHFATCPYAAQHRRSR